MRRVVFDRLDVVDVAAAPPVADVGTAGRRQLIEQARHRAIRAMDGDQLPALERGSPFALLAGDEDDGRVSSASRYIVLTLTAMSLRRSRWRARGSAST